MSEYRFKSDPTVTLNSDDQRGAYILTGTDYLDVWFDHVQVDVLYDMGVIELAPEYENIRILKSTVDGYAALSEDSAMSPWFSNSEKAEIIRACVERKAQR